MTESDLKNHSLLGKWFDGDEEATSVVISVSFNGEFFTVEAVDSSDEEAGEIHDVQWDSEVLSFAVHWASTGRFVKYKLRALSENRVDMVYTFTHQEIWRRLDDAEPV